MIPVRDKRLSAARLLFDRGAVGREFYRGCCRHRRLDHEEDRERPDPLGIGPASMRVVSSAHDGWVGLAISINLTDGRNGKSKGFARRDQRMDEQPNRWRMAVIEGGGPVFTHAD